MRVAFLVAAMSVGFAATSGGASSDLTCPADSMITENELTPSGVRSYFEKNAGKLKAPGDFVCCLPSSIRSNYMIAHDSFAGQNGSMESPRVILFPPLRKAGQSGMNDKPMKAALSINSHGSGMRQADSVEFMFNIEESGKLEYYDLTIDSKTGKSHMTEPNPQLCMSCHGADKHSATVGPRPLFAPSFSWDGFIKGRSSCGIELEHAIEAKVQKSILGNPTYRCLNPMVDGVSPFRPDGVRPAFIIDEFDRTMDGFNQRRIAKVLPTTPDFDKYQFAIAGTVVCPKPVLAKSHSMMIMPIASGAGNSNLEVEEDAGPDEAAAAPVEAANRIREWLPQSEIEKLNSQAALLPEIRGQKFNDALSFAKNRLSDIPKPPISINEHPTDIVNKCRAQDNGQARDIVSSIGAPKDALDDIYKRYTMDTALSSVRGRMLTPDFRVLTEARGVSIGWWGLQIWASYTRDPDDHLLRYMINEDPGGKLAQILKPIAKFLPGSSQLSFRNSSEKEQVAIAKLRSTVCSALKNASLAAFAKPAEAKATKRSERVIR